MVEVLIINNAEPGIDEFTNNILYALHEFEVSSTTINYHECHTIKLETYDGIILSGSPQGDDIVAHHLPYFQWIKTYNKPVFGICAGHHITGALYHAELFRSKEPESGAIEIEILVEDPITFNLPKKMEVKQMHNDSVSLPKGFILLATSKTCRNQLMKHNNKPLYTCQFHPEYYNIEFFRNFVEIVKKHKV